MVAGDTWTWSRYFARFLPSDSPAWAIQYFANGPVALTWFAYPNPVNGNEWLVNQPPSFGAAAPPGTYQFSAKATRANPNLGQAPATSPVFWQAIPTPPAYDSGTDYAAGAYVSAAGTVYLSLVAGNVGHDPATSPSQWQAVSSTVWAAGTTYPPGQYVTDAIPILYLALAGTEQHDVAAGVFTVVPNYGTAAAAKSFNQQKYEQLKAVSLSRTSADVQDYTIYGRRMVKIPILELEALLEKYKGLVIAEQNPGRIGMPVLVGFGGGGVRAPWPGFREPL